MIIDAHNHASWEGFDAEKFLANMDEFHIDKTLLLTCESPDNERNSDEDKTVPGPMPFSDCLGYFEKASDRFVLGYAPDPREPDAIQKLLEAKKNYGVKVYGEFKFRMMLDNPDAIRLFRVCGQEKMPVVVHIDYEFPAWEGYPYSTVWNGGGIESFERAIKACPDTIFIGHATGFWSHISCDDKCTTSQYPEGAVIPGGKIIDLLDNYKNLYCDISAFSGLNALMRDTDFAKKFLITYQDRILYGRDCCDNKHQEFLNSLNLPPEVLKKIYHKNAESLFM